MVSEGETRGKRGGGGGGGVGGWRDEGEKQRVSELHQHAITEWHGHIFQHQAQSKYQCANLSTSSPPSLHSLPPTPAPIPLSLSFPLSLCVSNHTAVLLNKTN